MWDKLFDELYLRTYAPLQSEDDAEAQARAGAALLALEPAADVLDAACGFGRHSLVLARDGFRVTGVDRSDVLLAEARRRSNGAEWPRWVHADLRELPFPDASFDGALNLFSSVLGYYGEEDDVRFLSELRRVLRPDGRLVVETVHRDRVMARFAARDWQRVPEGVLVEERTFDYVAGVNETLHELVPRAGDPVSLTYRVRIYTAGEVVRLLRRAGFATVDVHGDLAGAPLTRESRLVLVAAR